jgi:hypothetical protein
VTRPLLDESHYAVAESGCWVWTGTRTNGGYGVIYRKRAHRLMYEQVNGPIPAGLELDHTCENPPCINPDHLDAVTRPEHIRRTQDRLGKSHLHVAAVEMRRQGFKYQEIADALGWSDRVSAHAAVRYAIEKGLVDPESVPRRKTLTDADRADMTAMYRAGMKQTEIARIYGMHPSQVSRVVRGMRSGHGNRWAAA